MLEGGAVPLSSSGDSPAPPALSPLILTSSICGFWRRIGALLLDALVLGAVGFVLGLLLFDFLASLGFWGRVLGFCISLPYFGLLNSSLGGGQTIGKRLTGIRVVDQEGQPLSPGRSNLRAAILNVPFFLNNASVPMPPSLAVPISWLLGVVVFGGVISITYLYVFNRRTRQSLHDLTVGSYVVNAKPAGPVDAPPFWRQHLHIAAGLCGTLVVFMFLMVPLFVSEAEMKSLLALHSQIVALPQVLEANVFKGVQYGAEEQTFLRITVRWKEPLDGQPDFEQAANEVANVILAAPQSSNQDRIVIIVQRGFDIGIASGWINYTFHGTPEEWRKKLSPSGLTTEASGCEMNRRQASSWFAILSAAS